MNVNKNASDNSLKSNLARVDSHVLQASEYDELPELTDEMLARGTVKRGGRPVAIDPRLQVTIRLPASTLERWKASGSGWQTRMAETLTTTAPH